MKKFFDLWVFLCPTPKKLIMKLKIAFFIALVSISTVIAKPSYSQVAKVSLDMENKSIEQVMDKIEAQSEFYFVFNQKQIDINRVVSIQVEDKLITDILPELFKGTNVNYVILDKKILLTTDPLNSNILAIASTTEPQQKQITGTITDEKGNPLPGVNITVKGTTIGVLSDVNGKYTILNISPKATLVFSFVGMTTQEITSEGRTQIDVVLKESSVNLEEIVVIGYGTQKKINVTGSVASVNSEDLKKIPPISSTTNALSGIMPGLITQQTSGSPGKDAALLSIRGFGDALIIVDGSEGNFNNINPNEIESISVLKDASAAVYGARGGNGVILVTTKRGTLGKPIITLNSSYSLQSITDFPKSMSAGQYAEYDRESKIHEGLSESQQQFSEADVQKFYAGNDPNYPNTNWYKVLIDPAAPLQQHNLSVTGGTDQIKYFGLVGWMDQKSMWKNSGNDFQRFNIRSNIDAKITNNLSAQLDFSNINELRHFPSSEDATDYNWMRNFWQTWPIYPSSYPDPTKIPYTGDFNARVATNPNLCGFSDTGDENIKIGSSLKYNFPFIKGLSAKLFINYDQSYEQDKVMVFPVNTYTYDYTTNIYTLKSGQSVQGSLYHKDSKARTITNQLSLNYDHVFSENHAVSFLALFESINYNTDYIEAERINYLTTAIQYLFAGNILNQYANGTATEMGRESFIGRLNYSFKNKYLLDATLRADASAKFPSDKRWGYFPSLSVGWKISEESFLKDNIGWLSNLKLRGAISNMGYDNVGDFAYLSGYQFGNQYIFGTSIYNGLVSTGLANPNLTWENVNLYNLGLDFSLFKSKLYSEFDVFYRKLTGIPATRALSLPSTFGASLPPENINSSDNRGFEAKVGTKGVLGKLSWDISGNVSWSRAKWIHYEEPDYSNDPNGARVYKLSGQWTDRVMGYKTDGLYTSQAEIDAMPFDQDGQGNKTIKLGDIKFVDVNKDGVLDWKDEVPIGNGSLPHWMFGLTTTLNYRNFDLSFLFQGSAGNYVNVDLPWCAELFNDRWTDANDNPHALFPRSGSVAIGPAPTNSDFFLKKENYVRLKTLTFGYNLPNNLLKSVKISNLRIFFAGTNLFTLDKLKKYGLDPEAPSTAGEYYNNNAFFYPQQRTLTLGLTLTL